MKLSSFSFLVIIISSLLISCHETNDKSIDDFPKGKGIFIVNEGIFNQANASVDFYNLENDSLYGDIYFKKNNKKIGDILQNMIIEGDKAYLVVNNSGYVLKTNVSDFKLDTTISGLVSPRQVTKIDDDKYYITDIYSGKIFIFSSSKNKIISEINTGLWNENCVSSGDFIYVSCPWSYNKPESRKILIINSKTDKIVDSLKVGSSPNQMVIDHKGYLWTLCAGDSYQGVKGSLYKTDLNTKKNIDSIIFDKTLEIFNTSIGLNSFRDTLYILYNDVLKTSTDQKITLNRIIKRENRNFYGMSVDNIRNNIYVTDALNFAEKGNVNIYSKSGNLSKTLKSGYNPRSVIVY